MKTWQAFLVVIGGLVILAFILPEGLIKPVVYIIHIVAAVWVYFDAKKLDTKKYKSNLGFSALFLAAFVLFIFEIFFPAYLGFRYRIKHNLVALRDGNNQ
jgi:membrane protein YdbS with pleckstrin-like domain